MPKIKPEKITGIVAMSYLVLIPVAAAMLYQKVRIIDQDVVDMLDHLGVHSTAPENRFANLEKVKRFVGR